ncbi:MAG TPA: hypothetical protein VEA19_05860, partial [Actinomycetota bacterium]|nr:hypothetical protein [Actinomycetota bacterium]
MLSRRGSWLAAAMLVCVACTVGKVPAVAPSGTRQSPEATQDGAVLPVVAPGGFGDVLDGMRLAAEELTANGVPLRLERNPTLAAALDRSPRIVIVVGDGETVAQSRQAIESSGTVVVLIGADLYSDRRLFRNVFQVSPPLLWQARILVRYFAADRRHEQVRAVVGGPSAEAQRAALATAFREEGIRLRTAIPLQRVLSDPAALEATDGVIFLGGSGEGGELADAV